uniref:MYND-type domain-containing protein n=1 Tax=Chromera velia CCMP2878 TaxID=1169474 RepID=A0A0G4FTP8_9ALVE|eukprot:Cvel_18724.t1-p1 / transcript=Cvel_18724.t1 / gene=Cvel_18724 / organism=Chromera_velia_CCMP2878 / gene_product=hypothetical protein / transcript_product=hypothetical protein / location=Cvel_scaffold1570:5091-5570(+) / protein_length=160 / sequence_SO=supercontig / SO=protein_coding / is_pseudo=false
MSFRAKYSFLSEDTCVKISGLKQRADLNGKRAVVRGVEYRSGRFRVTVEKSGVGGGGTSMEGEVNVGDEVEVVAMKRANLKLRGQDGEACTQCGKSSSEADLKKCHGCLLVLYCGKECQRAYWKGEHKNECSQSFVAGSRKKTEKQERSAEGKEKERGEP